MTIKHIEDFKQEAVTIALNSGLRRAQIASDLGVGKSMLSKWMSVYRPSDVQVGPQANLAKENERLRVTAVWAFAYSREPCFAGGEGDIKKAQSALNSSSRVKDHEVRVY